MLIEKSCKVLVSNQSISIYNLRVEVNALINYEFTVISNTDTSNQLTNNDL